MMALKAMPHLLRFYYRSFYYFTLSIIYVQHAEMQSTLIENYNKYVIETTDELGSLPSFNV
jgi:hypothetical protein